MSMLIHDFTTYDAVKRQQILTDLMEEFCVVLSERVASDGNVDG